MPEIAEELGINARTLYTWVASDKSNPAVTDGGNKGDLEAENVGVGNRVAKAGHSKKSCRRVREGGVMRYQFIAEHAQVYPVQRQCPVLEVAESGYYALHKGQPSARQEANEDLVTEIQAIYQQQRDAYGSPPGACQNGNGHGAAVANGSHA